VPVLVRVAEERAVGDYDEASIRYTGRNIPSRSFRMLQQLTGGPADLDTSTPPGTTEIV